MGPLKYLHRGMYLLPLALLCACGLSDPQIPRAFYYDPPNKQIEGDPSATWIRYQSVARLTPGGYDTTDLESYDGEWFYYRNSAWNPADQVMYAYKVNYKPDLVDGGVGTKNGTEAGFQDTGPPARWWLLAIIRVRYNAGNSDCCRCAAALRQCICQRLV